MNADEWARTLDERVEVRGVSKRLGSCTVDDLNFLIAEGEARIAAAFDGGVE